MKQMLGILLVFLITQCYGYPMDYFDTPICGNFQNYYKIFPDIDTLMMENEYTGRDWWLVPFSECQNPFRGCLSNYLPICAYSNIRNEYKTFANECYLNVEKINTGIDWIKAFNFECPAFLQTYSSYESPSPVYESQSPVYESPSPVYEPVSPVYESPSPVYESPSPLYEYTATTIPPIQTYTPVLTNETTPEPTTTEEPVTTTSVGNITTTNEPIVTEEVTTTEPPIIIIETTTTPSEVILTNGTTSQPIDISTTEQPIIIETTTQQPIIIQTTTSNEVTETITTVQPTNDNSTEINVTTVTDATNNSSSYSPITEVSIYNNEVSPTTIPSYPSVGIIPVESQPGVRQNQYNVHNAPYAERDYYHQPIHNYYNVGPYLPTSQAQPNPLYSTNQPQNGFYGSLPYGPFSFGIPVVPVNYYAVVAYHQWLNHIRGV